MERPPPAPGSQLSSGKREHLRLSQPQATGILVRKLLLWSPEGKDHAELKISSNLENTVGEDSKMNHSGIRLSLSFV